ncbi:MAG: hypothetical protein RLZZ385_1894 [Pseudomonadota bacterium]
MPIYEYQCAACGHRLEAIQKFSDAPLTQCPNCEQSQLRKLVSAPSFRLKGGGWYETDFKQSGRKHLADSGDGAGNGTGGGNSGGGKDKPAAGESAASAGKAGAADKSSSTSADKKATESNKSGTSSAASQSPKTSTGSST